MKTKICSKCKIEKSIDMFGKNSSRLDGVQTYCQECTKKYRKHYDKTPNRKKYLENYKTTEGYKKYKKNHQEVYMKEYRELNKVQIAKKHLEYLTIKRHTDINYRLTENLRKRLNHALKGNTKFSSVLKLLGCSLEFLKQHLESQFKPGMSWINYGEWHVDHIRSCYTFNLSKPSEQRKCFNWKNLQPLWAEENCRKH
jgi:cation transport ATPase